MPSRSISIWGLGVLLLSLAGCTRSISENVPPSELQDVSDDMMVLIAKMVEATRFDGRWVVNRQPTGSAEVAFFFIRANADWEKIEAVDERLAAVRDNCAALRRENVIICDAQFLADFPARYLPVGRVVTQEMKTAAIMWMIGHELGHLAEDHDGVHFAGADDRRPRPGDLAAQRREYAADCWMVEQVISANGGDEVVLALERLAIDLMNRGFSDQGAVPVGVGILYDYNRVDPYDFRVFGRSHPDLLMRSVRILHLSALRARSDSLEAMLAPVLRKLVVDPAWESSGPCGMPS